ncbi:MAG: DUF4974 domain-containing protein [Bacteroidales bacterium]
MTKYLLVKYICGNTSPQEEESVHNWIHADSRNLSYFTNLKSAWIFQNIPADVTANSSSLPFSSESSNHAVPFRSSVVPKFGTRRFSTKFGVAAVIIVLLGFHVYFLVDKYIGDPKEADTRVLLGDIPAGYKHTVYTNKGTKAMVELPDGSTVWLNADSKIVFPDKFRGSTREVQICGEAFFDVVGDSLQPMIVSTNKNFKIRVKGTKFNVRSYDNDADAQTTLISGTVELIEEKEGVGEVVVAKLADEESYTIKANASVGIVAKSDTTKQIAWKNGCLIFDSTPLSEVIKQLERWHGTKFKVEDASILNFRYTAEFNSESIVQIMEMLKFISRLDYSIKDNVVHLSKKMNHI